MRSSIFLLFVWIPAVPITHAAVCDPKAFHGSYGFSLTGATTIGGPKRPVAVTGRLVLDGAGNLTGISSASFTGLILGNRVTGKYEARTDCSVSWSLQDDSGYFQHFAGTVSADGSHAAFSQTDRGGAQGGTLRRSMDSCSEASLAGTFQFTASGRRVDVDTGADSGGVRLEGVLTADGAGNLFFASTTAAPEVAAGTYEVAEDCFVHLVLGLPGGEPPAPAMRFRGIVTENGRGVLGIQTDPGTVVGLRLISN